MNAPAVHFKSQENGIKEEKIWQGTQRRQERKKLGRIGGWGGGGNTLTGHTTAACTHSGLTLVAAIAVVACRAKMHSASSS